MLSNPPLSCLARLLPLLAFLLTPVSWLLTPASAAPASDKPADGLRILEVLPSKLVVGVEQEVFVRVRYDLKSLDQAQLNLSFNTHESARYRTFAKEIVAKGTGEIVLTARVIPHDWGDLVFFSASVSLVEVVAPTPPSAPGQPRTPPVGRPALAFDQAPIQLTPKT